MSTKTYINRRLEEIQQELDALKSSVSLPEGFVVFNPTEEDKCPCDPKDKVLVKYRDGQISSMPDFASSWRWNNWATSNDIVAYKVIQKHVGPRRMKLAEIPVGVPFASNAEKPSIVFMKTNDGKIIVIYHELKSFGCGHSFFLPNDVDFYEVKISVGGPVTI